MTDAGETAARILSGDVRATARLLSLVERNDPERLAALKALHAHGGKARVVGVTGPPGAGKSTLADKAVAILRGKGHRVAVLAVDPSSPFTGGAILGDRIRMQRHSLDGGVFIRSLATRGHLGGLSAAVAEAVRVLDAAGYAYILVETVGVGQSEIDVVRVADTVVLVSVPGLGDDIQAIKAGVMEIGDVFCVNKADKDGADRVVREIRAMLETAAQNGAETRFSALYSAAAAAGIQVPGASSGAELGGGADSSAVAQLLHHGLAAAESGAAPKAVGQGAQPGRARQALAIPPVVRTVGETGEGVESLVDEVILHGDLLAGTGLLESRRRANLAWELGRAAADRVAARLTRDKEMVDGLAGRVLGRSIDFYDALEAIEADIGGRKLARPL